MSVCPFEGTRKEEVRVGGGTFGGATAAGGKAERAESAPSMRLTGRCAIVEGVGTRRSSLPFVYGVYVLSCRKDSRPLPLVIARLVHKKSPAFSVEVPGRSSWLTLSVGVGVGSGRGWLDDSRSR